MATETLTRLIDDLDGGEATETVTFALDGRTFEIDLSTKNANKLRRTLKVYVEHSQRNLTGPPPGHRTTVNGSSGSDQNQAIRAWARRKGYEVASRGRLKAEILEAYHKNAGVR